MSIDGKPFSDILGEVDVVEDVAFSELTRVVGEATSIVPYLGRRA